MRIIWITLQVGGAAAGLNLAIRPTRRIDKAGLARPLERGTMRRRYESVGTRFSWEVLAPPIVRMLAAVATRPALLFRPDDRTNADLDEPGRGRPVVGVAEGTGGRSLRIDRGHGGRAQVMRHHHGRAGMG